ncbi:hypothetical protein V6N12_048658 [Hibiscus sabdariffa]|uniref:Uncharacterized protein n=1 Tax=Hibiscus sabdariffa TaxID=183260 RepID=A0ABR2EHW7_9ROSI
MSNDSQRVVLPSFTGSGSLIGRPPDPNVDPTSLERPRSPSSEEVQRDPKKGKNHFSVDVVHGDEDVAMVEVDTALANTAQNHRGDPSLVNDSETLSDNHLLIGQHDPNSRISFKDILAGTINHQDHKSMIADLDVDVLEDDVSICADGPFPEISVGFTGGGWGETDRDRDLVQQGSGVPADSSSPLTRSKSLDSAVAGSNRQGDVQRETQVHQHAGRVMRNVASTGGSLSAGLVASKDKVVPVQTTLNRGNHCVVRVIDSSSQLPLKSKAGRILPPSIMAPSSRGVKTAVNVKGMKASGASIKKKLTKASSKNSLQNLVDNLSSELDDARTELEQTDTAGANSSITIAANTGINWQGNSSFVVDGDTSMQDWIAANLRDNFAPDADSGDWHVRFSVICWQLWKRRCNLLFNDLYVERDDFLDSCSRLASEYIAHHSIGNSGLNQSNSAMILWKKPPPGVADGLACLGRGASFDAWCFMDPPLEIVEALSTDLHSAT